MAIKTNHNIKLIDFILHIITLKITMELKVACDLKLFSSLSNFLNSKHTI